MKYSLFPKQIMIRRFVPFINKKETTKKMTEN